VARSHGAGKIPGIPRLERPQGWDLGFLVSALNLRGANRFPLFIPSLCLPLVMLVNFVPGTVRFIPVVVREAEGCCRVSFGVSADGRD